MSEEQKDNGMLEGFAIVEVMGYSRYAGYVRQVAMGGGAMIRVDVPDLPERDEAYTDYVADGSGRHEPQKKTRKVSAVPGYTKFLGVSAIFAITPCSEEVALAAVERFRAPAVTILDMPVRRSLPSPEYIDEDDE